MRSDWFVQIAGEIRGPLTDKQLIQIALSGQLTPLDSVRKGSTGDWVPAKSVRGLFKPRKHVKRRSRFGRLARPPGFHA